MDLTAPFLRVWGAIFYLALGPSMFSYVIWYRILHVVPVNRVALSLFF